MTSAVTVIPKPGQPAPSSCLNIFRQSMPHRVPSPSPAPPLRVKKPPARLPLLPSNRPSPAPRRCWHTACAPGAVRLRGLLEALGWYALGCALVLLWASPSRRSLEVHSMPMGAMGGYTLGAPPFESASLGEQQTSTNMSAPQRVGNTTGGTLPFEVSSETRDYNFIFHRISTVSAAVDRLAQGGDLPWLPDWALNERLRFFLKSLDLFQVFPKFQFKPHISAALAESDLGFISKHEIDLKGVRAFTEGNSGQSIRHRGSGGRFLNGKTQIRRTVFMNRTNLGGGITAAQRTAVMNSTTIANSSGGWFPVQVEAEEDNARLSSHNDTVVQLGSPAGVSCFNSSTRHSSAPGYSATPATAPSFGEGNQANRAVGSAVNSASPAAMSFSNSKNASSETAVKIPTGRTTSPRGKPPAPAFASWLITMIGSPNLHGRSKPFMTRTHHQGPLLLSEVPEDSKVSFLGPHEPQGGKERAPQRTTEGAGNATEVSGNATEVSGDATEVSGDATEVSGNATEVSGNDNEVAGNVTEVSGDALLCLNETEYSSNYRPGPQRYMMVGGMTEQLSKARRHLAEIVALCKLSNRTLVLPHCGNSRIGSVVDLRWPLCSYFDVTVLAKATPWVSEGFFQSSVLPQLEAGNGTVAALIMAKPEWGCNYTEAMELVHPRFQAHGSQPHPHRHLYLLPRRLMRYAAGAPALCLSSCSRAVGGRQGQQGPDGAVRRDPLLTSADVIVVVRGSTQECGSQAFRGQVQRALRNLQYAPHLVKLVDKFLYQNLGGAPLTPQNQGGFLFISFHWRIEHSVRGKLKRTQLLQCAKRAVKTLATQKQKMARQLCRASRAHNGNATMVHPSNCTGPALYFSTDISAGGRWLSTSWDKVRPRDFGWALRTTQMIHKQLQPFTLSSFGVDVASSDVGILGILDKIVSSRASLMFYVPKHCRGKYGSSKLFGSSFVQDVCELRVKNKRKLCRKW